MRSYGGDTCRARLPPMHAREAAGSQAGPSREEPAGRPSGKKASVPNEEELRGRSWATPPDRVSGRKRDGAELARCSGFWTAEGERAEAAASGSAAGERPSKSPRRDGETALVHPRAELDDLQRGLVRQFVSTIDANEESIVITNPRAQGPRAAPSAPIPLRRPPLSRSAASRAGNPIVWVTRPWQDMCGFTYGEAVSRNPRLTQGERSDPAVVSAISGALKQAHSSPTRAASRLAAPPRPATSA